MGVEKREGQIEKELTWSDEPLIEVPDLVGRTMREINESYYELKVELDGEGKNVLAQSPEPGVKVTQGSTIRLYMGDKSD